MSDPFRHHPGLRDLIAAPETSFFRRTSLAELRVMLEGKGVETDWWHSDDEREAGRDAFLADHEGDLWIFGYGSLMWDPGVQFAEVRRAKVPGYARRFILKDIYGGRGDRDAPGLMVALDRQATGTCHGLLFRIPGELLEAETHALWRRERLGPAYRETWVDAETALGQVRALTFSANHASELIVPDMTFEDQVAFAATGTGFLGTSHDYLRGVAQHLEDMRIEDAEVRRLLAAVDAWNG